jgi:mRNA-degrading endonuclease RelE of RelBE toxin-antitoxin system
VSESPRYDVRVSAGAARTIQLKLPEAVATAVVEFITGSLLDNPQRVGRELRNELAGVHSARRGAFRILYEIDERLRLVTVLRVEHRADVYRHR